ncbi:MAG TPA: bifunctional nicotinamidase/pyrazinamidase [Chitinispirillaceae bacterium]|nr:bifunctional nicotinamidase/pyrazinamidase [Chitinispirillaceae bacterium]
MNALIIVDIQYDFMPGGALAVAEGDQLAEPVLEIRDTFDNVIFTQDWHPANHCSFKKNGGIWPVHCVQNSNGAGIDRRIIRSGDKVIRKGTHQEVDSYSGFWDNDRKHKTGLDDFLKSRNIDTVYICGLATDYCVKFTVLDAIDAGYKVFLIADLCRGVNINPLDSKNAVEEMKMHGTIVINHKQI